MKSNISIIPKILSQRFESPFSLIDVGCSGGIDTRWRRLGSPLIAHGFDPQVEECEALNETESSPTVHYHAAKVGLDATHPVAIAQAAERLQASKLHLDYFSPLARSSAFSSPHLRSELPEQSNSIHTTWSTASVTIDDFCVQERLNSLDFLKIDTDGFDLEVLQSAESTLRDRSVLGILVESAYTGMPGKYVNTLSNIDSYLRQFGYMIYDLEINRYSRRTMPSPFCHDILAQTKHGQAIWGDVLFMRDINHPAFCDFSGGPVTLDQVLKSACIFDLFGLPDCCADTLITHREVLADIDVDHLLGDLTSQITNGRERDFSRYIKRFEQRPETFFASYYTFKGFVFRNPLTRPFAQCLREWVNRR